MNLMPDKKQKIINETLKYLLSEIEKVEPRTADLLRKKINGKEVPVYFKVLPSQKEIKTSSYRNAEMQTKGLTTTFYDSQTKKPIAHIITIPEEEFFAIHNGNMGIKKQGIATLLHELKHLSRAGFAHDRIIEELEADLFTAKMLKQLRLEKERQEYVESRPVFKKFLERARAKRERRIRARIIKKRQEEKLKKLREMYEKRDVEEEYRLR